VSLFGTLCSPSNSHIIKKDGTLPGVNTSVLESNLTNPDGQKHPLTHTAAQAMEDPDIT